MAEIIVQQVRLFLAGLFYGLVLGVWYDFFRVVRKKIEHRNRMVHMEDVVFCFSAAAGLFFLFQICNQGQIRFYVLLALFAGTILYFVLFSIWVEKVLGMVVGAAVVFLKTVFAAMTCPLKIIVNSLLKTLKKVCRTIRIMKGRK